MSEYRLPSISKRRSLVNLLTARLITTGGIAVISVIILLMGYLLWVVVPAFMPASMDPLDAATGMPTDVLHVGSNDSFEVLTMIRKSGDVEFRNPDNFELLKSESISNENIAATMPAFGSKDVYAVRTGSNELFFIRLKHQVRYLDNIRSMSHEVERLFDESLIALPPNTETFDVSWNDELMRIVVDDVNGKTTVIEYRDVDELFELEFRQEFSLEPSDTKYMSLFGPRSRWIYQIDKINGAYRLLEIRSIRSVKIANFGFLRVQNEVPLSIELLLGRNSLLTGDAKGSVNQFSLITSGEKPELALTRIMEFDKPVVRIASELRRKGFLAIDEDNTGHLAYTTSERELASFEFNQLPDHIAFSPRADRIVTLTKDVVRTFDVSNPHPEISWSTIWGKVWYEGYDEPKHIWQSSSADTEFEAKFSLAPLLFGTMKAAFYAMLFAIPIAVMGAIYCANFMSPGMRAWVKPSIEIMAALPTVILGFLAGLWLAPIVEASLTSFMLLVIVVPVGMLVFALLWSRLPGRFTARFDGWHAALGIPVIVLLIWGTLAANESLSQLIFGGDAATWFFQKWGIDYDQRNALIIGIAMGLAVVPTIFSIAEDAIYGVPQHLVHGSLALGATRWQTLVRVVLQTASPGIFAAIMIGFGRAVGETMIVLMATGNTPIMDFNLFQGMRTFAANIAVEMPESEANSTHFRILFLTALVLFVITFMFNTVAEVVRQRLRARYGNL